MPATLLVKVIIYIYAENFAKNLSFIIGIEKVTAIARSLLEGQSL